MPEYRGISITLQSQYDAVSIPEYAPSSASSTPRTPSPQHSRAPSNFSLQRHIRGPEDELPYPVIEVNIPIYPGSQFWIVFHCPEPSAAEIRFYYFKLFVGTKCLLSWGAGEEECWSGRVTFGIYDGGRDFEDRRILEKRAFFFPNMYRAQQSGGGSFEIRVFRSKARKRGAMNYEKWVEGSEGNGMKVNNAGRVKKTEPRRWYTYALIDPVNEPYVAFRWHARTGAHLRGLGILAPTACIDREHIDTATRGRDIPTRPYSQWDEQSQLSLASPLSILSSPPPKDTPLPPPSPQFTGKDSIALRRASLPPRVCARTEQQPPLEWSKLQRNDDIFDPFDGLSLASSRSRFGSHEERDAAVRSTSPIRAHARKSDSLFRSNSTGLFKGISGMKHRLCRIRRRRSGSGDDAERV